MKRFLWRSQGRKSPIRISFREALKKYRYAAGDEHGFHKFVYIYIGGPAKGIIILLKNLICRQRLLTQTQR